LVGQWGVGRGRQTRSQGDRETGRQGDKSRSRDLRFAIADLGLE